MPDDQWLTEEREHERVMARMEADQVEAERKHERALASERTTRVGYVSVALAVVAVVLGICWFVWSGATAGRAADERLKQACIERGGSWTSLGGAEESCYQIGTVEES